MSTATADLDLLTINTIRLLAVDAVEKAGCGHPGLPMGAAPMAHVLWNRHLRHNPTNPEWPNRDRFILSPGHGCMLIYALLHLYGYDLSLEDLTQFRQWGSKTPGHSEFGHTAGVETTTGPLGQGISNGVGMGIAQKYLAAYFNRPGHDIVDNYVYAIVSDGDLMEGVASEACSLAGHLKLDNLIYLYDDNHISIEGHTTVAFTEDRAKRFEAYGWHVQTVSDGNDIEAIDAAIKTAQSVKDQPHIIMVRTLIGYGSPNKADTHDVHGAKLGPDEVKATKKNLGWDPEKDFHVPGDVAALRETTQAAGKKAEADWNAKFDAYAKAHPDLAQQFKDWFAKKLPAGWADEMPSFEGEKPMATRKASGAVLQAIGPKLPMLLGGSADLAPSTNTIVKGSGDFQSPANKGDEGSYAGRNLHFGVREHGMGAALNGMALSQALIPYGATFMMFSDYCKPAIRLSAFMKVQSIWVFTHDSIGLGEDGPTHQPVEQLVSLRSIPGLRVFRPSDATEVPVAWKSAIEHRDGPTVLVLTRQNLPVLDRKKYGAAEGLLRGGYILKGSADETPDVILLASGSEVSIALDGADKLEASGHKVRVVAMPSMDLFDAQSDDYKEQVLPSKVRARVAVEAAHPMAWQKYVGLDGGFVCVDTYGASAPAEILYEKYGLTPDNVAATAKQVLAKNK